MWIGYPRNQLPLSFKAKHHLLIAAGIGITPFMAMMAELQAKGASFELHYAARSREDCAFYDEIMERYPEAARYYFSDRKQRLSAGIMRNQRIGTHVYICGPGEMIEDFKAQALGIGYLDSRFHCERFSPLKEGPSDPFEAVLASSGRICPVPGDRSLLEALLAQGVDAPFSCRIGGCGSCAVEVEEGQVEHRDFFLSEEERLAGNVMMTCVSRA